MSPEAALHLDTRRDGFGVRRFDQDPQAGRVEVLDLSPELATPASEQAIRTRAARFGKAPMLATIHRIARVGDTLSVTSAAPAGVTLADVLAALEFGTVSLSEQGILELAAATIRAVAAMHELPGAPAHGALSPAHVLFCRDGGVLLIYGPFMRGGVHNAPSNAAFDASLRARNPDWGVRDVDDVSALAQDASLTLTETVSMPANNFVLIFRRNQ